MFLIMSSQFRKLCSLILLENFGETVEKVGIDLFKCGSKPLKLICNSTNLSANEVNYFFKKNLFNFNLTSLQTIITSMLFILGVSVTCIIN